MGIRRVMRASALLAICWAALFGSTTSAQAAMPQGCHVATGLARSFEALCSSGFRVDSRATFTGWAKAQGTTTSSCPTCLDIIYRPTPAYRWTGTAWQATTIARDTWVWVAPYATGWSWVWTQQTGWLAAQDWYLYVPGAQFTMACTIPAHLPLETWNATCR